jgi:hypothetical protein
MKILLTLIAAAVLATGAWAGTSLVGDSDPGRTVSLPGATTGDATTATTGASATNEAEDVSGPCDEAEHANDPRCAGTTPAGTTPAAAGTTGTTTADGAEDVSGPCDEAEHGGDPRCTGAAGAQADDDGDHAEDGEDHGRDHRRGGDDDSGGDDHGDRSGSNSGRG